MSVTLDALLTRSPDVCGGRLRIDGTRITVHRIATLYKQGQGPEEMAKHLPVPRASGQIYAALAYYHANREEIESALAAADALYDDLQAEAAAEAARHERRPS